MFRVLLPEGELTLSTRIEFLYEGEKSSGGTCLKRLTSSNEIDKVNALFIHLKAPQTTSDGVFIGNLNKADVELIKTSLLKDSFFDFTTFEYDFACNMLECENNARYYALFSDKDFESIVS